jgi:hypothetical protein
MRLSGFGAAGHIEFYTAERCRSAEWPPLISVVVVAAKIVKKEGD